jgi:archaemetzincin
VIVKVQPIGPVNGEVLENTGHCIRNHFRVEVELQAGVPEPVGSRDERRRQYSSVAFMLELARLNGEGSGGGRTTILGVTERDLFIPALTFVFGQAQLNGGVALVSVARLRQEFYGLPADAQRLAARTRKEVIHELGHTLGLTHCPERTCAMSLSTSILQVDVKEDRLCEACRRMAEDQLASFEGTRT